MESELLDWLEVSANTFLGHSIDRNNSIEVDSGIIEIGSLVLSRQFNTAEEVLNFLLQELTERSFDIISYQAFLLEAILIFSVGDSCSLRVEFVNIILGLEHEVQVYLMNVIQDNLTKYEKSVTAAIQSDSTIEKVALESVRSCNDDKERENIIHSLHSEIESLRKAQHDIENHWKAALSVESSKLVDSEIAFLEKEKEIASLLEQNAMNLQKIEEMELHLKNHHHVSQSMRQMEDELEILRDQAAQAGQLEVQVSQLRNKLDDMSSIRQQWVTESEAHAQTFQKLVTTENELQAFRKYKAQMEEYREKNAELIIESQEIKLRLEQKQQEVDQLQNHCHSLNGGKQQNREDSQSLLMEVQALQAEVQALRQGKGVGSALSELNPEIMQEITFLRSENQRLHQLLSQTAQDSLDRMEAEIADQKVVHISLQQKLCQTKDQLATAQGKIQHLEQQADFNKEQWRVKTQERDETETMMEEDVGSQRRGWKRKYEHLQQSWKAERWLQVKSCQLLVAQWESSWKETEDQRIRNETEWKKCQQALLESQQQSHQFQDQNRHLLEQSELQQQHHIHQLIETKQQHECLSKEMETKFQQELEKERIEKQRWMEIERENQIRLQEEIEEEKSKRRRIEREKKMADTEIHRLKMHIQVSTTPNAQNCSMSGVEVENLVKELRSTQKDLDVAREEIAVLKARQSFAPKLGEASHSQGLNKMSSSDTTLEENRQKNGLISKPQRMIRNDLVDYAGSSATNSTMGSSSSTLTSFMELSEMKERQLDQLNKEKRELLARSFEENKEKGELTQKIVLYEKEISQLTAKNTKLTLEKERLERKLFLANAGDTEKSSNKQALSSANRAF